MRSSKIDIKTAIDTLSIIVIWLLVMLLIYYKQAKKVFTDQ